MLRSFAHEIRSEQKWEDLYKTHPEPVIRMAKQALKEHKDGRATDCNGIVHGKILLESIQRVTTTDS